MAKEDKESKDLDLWRPFKWMSSVFDDFMQPFTSSLDILPGSMRDLDLTCPRCDMVDQGDKYEITVEVPGVDKNDLNIEVDEDSVEISSKKEGKSEEKGKVVRKEQYQRSYYRKLQMPEKVISDKTEANLKNGILYLTLPKKELKKDSKKTKVKIT